MGGYSSDGMKERLEEDKMEIVFYNKNGRPVAYSEDWGTIYLYNGEPVAYIYRDAVYAFSGLHLGWFVEGRVVDHAGRDVFFTDLAMGRPVVLIGLASLRKGVRRATPIRQPREPKPAFSERKYAWAPRCSERFFFRLATPALHRIVRTFPLPFRGPAVQGGNRRERGRQAA